MKRSVAWAVKDEGKVSASRVAARTLRKRLDTVWSELQAACRQRHDPERVHQLRVATRRTLAALTAFRDLVPKKQRGWFEQRLRRVRQAAGATRDLDVLRDEVSRQPGPADKDPVPVTLSARKRLVVMLARRRDVSRESIREIRETLVAEDWPGRVEQFLSAVAARSSTESFLAYAHSRFPDLLRRFFDRADRKLVTADEIHRLRIAGKKLRYALEIFAVAIPAATKTACLEALEKLQETLGSVTDHAAAAGLFRRWAREDGGGVDRTTLVAFRRHQEDRAKRSRRAFVKWWKPSRRRALRRSLEQILERVSP
jgi:CHAD domain-containing protein